ncbi:MAG: hypothetical protein OEV94_07720 [Deltaproteobacteria bacterium]|nr:hypothetical protein [Deltaproteobacteria bacterium]
MPLWLVERNVLDDLNEAGVVALPWVVGWCVVLSALRLVWVIRRPMAADIAPPKGSSAGGAFYALTFAMLPWKKESTRHHWATYTAGMLMHLAVFVVILYGGARWVGWGQQVMGWVVLAMGPVGLAAAVGLLVKRGIHRGMRAISSPDDVLSNLLVDAYLLGAVLTAWSEGWLPMWRLAFLGLLVWIPLGKLFHMVLFFFSRVFFGWQFGRRGVIRWALPVSY